MKKLALAVLAAGLSLPAAAQPVATTVSVQAAGGWEMICHVATRFGNEQVVILDAGHSSLSSGDFNNISCEQTGSGRGPMVVSVTGPASCPFKGAAAGSCQQSFASGRVGSFVVKSKRP